MFKTEGSVPNSTTLHTLSKLTCLVKHMGYEGVSKTKFLFAMASSHFLPRCSNLVRDFFRCVPLSAPYEP